MHAPIENTIDVRPHPADFIDFRAYLRAMIRYLKQHRPSFSYRAFSRRAGFSSPNFLKLVAEGQRNLSTASVEKFARGLGLAAEEQQAFERLVLMSGAVSHEERERHFRELRRLKTARSTHHLEAAQFELYATWYALPIREMMLHPDFREDPGWIGRQLRPEVTAAEVRSALALLEQMGLAVRDADGRLRPADTSISTGPQTQSLAVRAFHRRMIQLASAALDAFPPSHRDASSLTLSLTRDRYLELRERIARFRAEILAEFGTPEDAGTHDVYQVNVQLFPLTAKEP